MISIIRQRSIKHLLAVAIRLRSKLFPPGERTELYFGYGANLSVDRFKREIMNAEELGNAVLADHEIKFSLANEYKDKGYAGVHAKHGQEVWGALYRMDKLSLLLLDALEWCGLGAYERKEVFVTLEGGATYRCWCYFVKHPKDDLYPSKRYLQNIIKTAQERGFPPSYIDFIRSHQYREKFDLDHGFSLLFYGSRRPFLKQLAPIYKFHDHLREKLCDLI